MSELEGEGGEDRPKVSPGFEIPRTEETGPELPICKTHLCERLGDGRLPCPSEAVEPEHAFGLFVPGPLFEVGEDISPGPLHAPLSFSTEVPGVSDMANPLDKVKVRSILFADYYELADSQGKKLTIS